MSQSSSRPRVYPKIGSSTALPVLLALLPFAYLVRLCVTRYVDVPAFDDWAVALHLNQLYAGTLTLGELWRQHNEHRPIVPVVILMTLARLTDWNTNWEIVLNVSVGVGIFAVFCAYLRTAWRAHGGAPLWLVPLLSTLLFSTVQWENFLRGWQLTILLGTLASVFAVYRMTARVEGAGRLASGIAAAVCASYSFASGLVLWPAQALGIVAAGGPRWKPRLTWWSVAGAITWMLYFYGFQRPPQPSMLSNFTSLQSVRMFVLYVLAYLGAPIGGFDQRAAIGVGLAGLAAFVAVALRLRHLRTDPVFLFPAVLGIQTILTAIISGLGRAWMGLDQALSARYTTVAMPLWCGLVCLVVLWRRTAPVDAWAQARRLTVASLLTVTLGLSIMSMRPAVFHAAGHSERLHFARRGLILGKSDVLLLELIHDATFARQQRAMLKRQHLSVFRRSIQPTYPLPGDE